MTSSNDIVTYIGNLTVRPAEPPDDSMWKQSQNLCEKFTNERQHRIPRFLFRGWHARSGGGTSGLNTTTAVTPLAFLGRKQPPLWHHSRDTIIINAQNHLMTYQGLEYRTFFSSWSQSLALAMSMARQDHTSHISVIDTKLLLEDNEDNVILYTPEMQQLDHGYSHHHHHHWNYDREFLIYGVVSGPAYKAVSLDTLGICRLRDLRRPVQDALPSAQKLGAMFGEFFKLPMTIYFLTSIARSTSDFKTIASELSKWDVPKSWMMDWTIMTDSWVNTGKNAEAERAIDLLRLVVLSSITKKSAHTEKQVDDCGEQVKALRHQIASLSTKEAKRDVVKFREIVDTQFSNLQKKLYIDMIGWDVEAWENLGRTRQQTKMALK